jgi:hypothetical protein
MDIMIGPGITIYHNGFGDNLYILNIRGGTGKQETSQKNKNQPPGKLLFHDIPHYYTSI